MEKQFNQNDVSKFNLILWQIKHSISILIKNSNTKIDSFW